MSVESKELKKIQEITGAKLAHIGILVKDIYDTVDTLSFVKPTMEWRFKETVFYKKDMIVGEPFKIKIALTEIDGMTLEVLQPFDSPDCYMSKYMDAHGEGLHHFAFHYDNHKEHIAVAERLGRENYKCVHHAAINGVEVHYFECASGIVVELKSNLQ